MFTVRNRDVILQISVAALLLIALFPSAALAHSRKITHDKKTRYGDKTHTVYPHQKKHPKNKKANNSKEKKSKSSIPADRHHHASSTIKTSSENNVMIRYAVKKGDTLTRISKKYNIPIQSILSSNKLKNKNSITKGCILKIPVKKPLRIAGKNTVDEQKSNSSTAPRFQWPVRQVVGYHNDGLNGVRSIGIVITGKPGSTVLSSAPGTVKKIGTMRGFGKYIVIHHSGRYATVYSNLDQITVSVGDTIQAGNTIGTINYFDRKLHFQIDLEGKPENPLKYLPKNI